MILDGHDRWRIGGPDRVFSNSMKEHERTNRTDGGVEMEYINDSRACDRDIHCQSESLTAKADSGMLKLVA